MYFILGMLIGLFILAIVFSIQFLIDNPDVIPGHHKRVAKRTAKERAAQLAQDKAYFKDITELAVSMGYPDIRPDGWYGFHVETKEGVAYLGERRFYDICYRPRNSAKETLTYVLDGIHKEMKHHLTSVNVNKQLEQMVNGNMVLGDRKPWVED